VEEHGEKTHNLDEDPNSSDLTSYEGGGHRNRLTSHPYLSKEML